MRTFLSRCVWSGGVGTQGDGRSNDGAKGCPHHLMKALAKMRFKNSKGAVRGSKGAVKISLFREVFSGCFLSLESGLLYIQAK